MSWAFVLGMSMVLSLLLYALSGGADFGGGVWDLLASGERKAAQREMIKQAIGPIWEANHVWLIVVIVVMFVAFPKVFAAVGTLLHVPLTLMLVGIILRGSAFVFRTYDDADDETQRRWSLVFSISSTLTPIMLGICLGAVVSGKLPVDALQQPSSKLGFAAIYITPWLQPFSLVLGLYILALFAFLAAVYLLQETEDQELQEDFRLRALASGVAVGVLAWVALLLSGTGAPRLAQGLAVSPWALPFQLAVAGISLATLAALWKRKYAWARVGAIVQVSCIVIGWGLAQYPYLIVPHLTLHNAAAPASVLRPVAITLGLGALLVLPAFAYLYKTFKSPPS